MTLILPWLVAGAQGSTGTVAGIALDSARTALGGVEIQVDGGRWRAVTDDRGMFRVEGVSAGSHRLVGRRIGLAPDSVTMTVTEGHTSDVRLTLRPSATELGAVDVVDSRVVPARLQGFEERRARNRNGGHFMTRVDIERIMPSTTSDLLRRFQGVKVVDSMGVSLAVSARGPKMTMVSGRPVPVQCVVRIGVDGSLKEPYFAMNSIPQGDIHGIEVYAGAATIPPEFNGARRDASCGLIMIWTRSR